MIKNYKVTKILNTYVLIPNTHTIHVHRMIKINAVGVFLFELLSKEISYEDILETFIKTYGLSLDQGRRDFDHFIKRLKDNNVLDTDTTNGSSSEASKKNGSASESSKKNGSSLNAKL